MDPITQYISTARKNNYSDADIKKRLAQAGHSDAFIEEEFAKIDSQTPELAVPPLPPTPEEPVLEAFEEELEAPPALSTTHKHSVNKHKEHTPIMQPAPLLRRMSAALIDLCLLAVLACIALAAGMIWYPGELYALLTPDVLVLIAGIGLLISIFYDATTTASSWRGTLGKHLVGVRVYTTQQHRVTFARSLTRALIKPLLALGVGSAFVNKRHQTVTDKLVKTVVMQN